MRRFLIKTTCIALPFLFLAIWAECTLRSMPNDYQFTFDYLSKHCHEIEILNLGSSHGDNSINPDYFSRPAFNAGISGQPLEYDYAFIDTFIDSLDLLKVLILPISYFSLNRRELHYSLERNAKNDGERNLIQNENIRAMYYKLYCPFMHNPIHRRFLFIRTLPFGNVRKVFLNSVRKVLFKTSDAYSVDISANGCTMLYGTFNPQEQARLTQDIITEDKYLSSATATCNNQRVVSILQRCQKRNIQVILLSTPVTDIYREGCNPIQWAYVQEKCEQWAHEYGNTIYVNMFASTRFTYDDFGNCNHLNIDGAKKCTLILDSIIENSLLPQSYKNTL